MASPDAGEYPTSSATSQFSTCTTTLRIAGALRDGQEIATGSVIALKAAWQGKGGSN